MTPLATLIILAFIGTLAALFIGIGSMAHGGKFDLDHEVQLMVARVSLQGLAFVLILLAVYSISH